MALLEGLEVKEKLISASLNNKDFRIDSQFYTKEPYKSPFLNYEKIGNLLIKAQYGISIAMNEYGEGYSIYRMNEIHNMLCDSEVLKHAKVSNEELLTFTLNDRDVVFNRTNSYEWVGRTGIYKKLDTRPFVFASYLVRFIPDQEKLLPEYLTAFLNCKYGVRDIKRRARQSINQTNVNPEEVKEIEIPKLSIILQNSIRALFDKAHFDRIESKQAYTQAEKLLLYEIGLQDFQPISQAVNIKCFQDSFATSGRLDAEYYQKKYEQILQKVKTQIYDHLDNIIDIKKSIEPGSKNYALEGLPFMRVADISKQGLLSPQKFISYDFVHLNYQQIQELKPKKDTILFSKDGSVGIAYHLRENYAGITSSALLHLTLKDKTKVIPEYLTLVLNSEIVQMQAERDSGGSIIKHWRVSEIKSVVVPIIDYKKQQQIATLIEQSFTLKQQSEYLLAVAKNAVEIAIEHNEAEAKEYILANTKESTL